ncbi:hypothetical protein PoB_003328000 [Plakobranchus ocellatus]|uniref:Uncharacterized protein n=1 Tax=Plakobranchus ocellatus TaxID=259542 RepID=A0AAV4AF21_9GAST|nr:hypothetical protein PoB_003328000 [Plakobranchus ocellatus]
MDHGIHYHRLFVTWQATLWLACQAYDLFGRLHPIRHMDLRGEGWVSSVPDSTRKEEELEDSRRRSRWDERKWEQKTKLGGEKVMSLVYRREAVHRRQPALVTSYKPLQMVEQFLPWAPHRGLIPSSCIYRPKS